MRNVNTVILIGNVTRDPVMKKMDNGQMMISFGVATNRNWVTNGQRKTDVEFHNVVTWGKLAEICNTMLRKGQLVYVEGYLKTRTWDNADGTRSFRTEIVADDVIFLNSPKDRDGESYEQHSSTPSEDTKKFDEQEKEMENMKSEKENSKMDDGFENLID